VHITYRNSLSDLALFIVRCQLKRPFPILGMILVSAAIVHFMVPDDPMCRACALVSALLWGGTAFVTIYILQLTGQLIWRVLRGGFGHLAEHSVELHAHALVGSSANARSEVRWSCVSGIGVFGQRMFLDAGTSFVFCVPARAFRGPAEFDAFVACARKLRASASASN